MVLEGGRHEVLSLQQRHELSKILQHSGVFLGVEVHLLWRDTGPGDSGKPEIPECRRDKEGSEINGGG